MGHNYMGPSYIGHSYIGHHFIGHNYIGRNYRGHNCIGHNCICHDHPVGELQGLTFVSLLWPSRGLAFVLLYGYGDCLAEQSVVEVLLHAPDVEGVELAVDREKQHLFVCYLRSV